MVRITKNTQRKSRPFILHIGKEHTFHKSTRAALLTARKNKARAVLFGGKRVNVAQALAAA